MGLRILLAVVLVAPALLLGPLEQRIQRERAVLKYGGAHAALQLRDQLGQGLAIGLLAGFRGVVADFLWIQNHEYFEDREWLRMYRNLEVVTLLQPQSALFWDLAAWHMAWNIGYAVRTDPHNRTQAEGIKREREWIDKAQEFLRRGIANLPNQYDLYYAMGWLHWQKLDDAEEAAHYFGLAAQFPDAPSFVPRMYSRALERVGDPEGAYRYWKRIWNQDHERVKQPWHLVEWEIRRLENLLRIPNDQRLFPRSAAPGGSRT